MDFVEKIPLELFLIFVSGLLLIYGGISIIRNKKTVRVSRNTDPRFWRQPTIISGKKAVYEGISLVVGGVLFIAFSVAAYYASQ